MVRELAIFLFLLVFKGVFSFFNLLPIKDKVTFVVSFGDNSKAVINEIRRQRIPVQVVALCKRNRIDQFRDHEGIHLIPFDESSVFRWDWLRSIYHLATSRYVLLDNYYGFLAAAHFKQGVQCIQLWHATGALKKFGLEDETVKFRSPRAVQRFLRVYSRFNKVVVGSDAMADIFMRSFNIKNKQILKTGIPNTDVLFDDQFIQEAKKKLVQPHVEGKNKKVILYAPTYRDNEVHEFNLQLNIENMYEKLGHEYILFLRLHPAIKKKYSFPFPYNQFIVDVSSDEYEQNELLVVADYLITDYSSIFFDYLLLGKPIIFFTYDLETYKQSRGLIEGFEKHLPGPMAKNTEELIKLILAYEFDLEAITICSEKWNKYCKGQASDQLVQYMFQGKNDTSI